MESTVSFKKVLPVTCISSYLKLSNSYMQKSAGIKNKNSSDY